MDTTALPLISSFIIRFVVEAVSVEPPAYHGSIRHIQSAEEINFNEWQEAVEFMRRFVPLNDLRTPKRCPATEGSVEGSPDFGAPDQNLTPTSETLDS